ncbi:hypothetical protein GCM10023191_085960 [Actinoallomurus oryzae]|uniref:Secreted protein n=1 Tax=Actinoallomurus oryzae TaxID=502180 RepID=A0ABP8R1Q3_9ACTN
MASVYAVARRVLGPPARLAYRLTRAAARAAGAYAVRLSSADTRPGWMNRLPANRFALAALVVLAVAALYGVASFARPAASAPRHGTTVPVTSAYAACPDTHGARVSAVTPPGARGSGQASVAGAPVVLTTPGTAWSDDVTKGAGPWVFGAQGSLAPGLTVEQTTSDGGLAGTRCVQPATDLWFAGPGPADADGVSLYLTNVDDRPVTALVTALSPEGSIETPEGQDEVPVGPHSTRLVQVGVQVEGFGQAAADAKLVALHVHALTGRLSAAVRVERKKGADWLPETAPSRRVVVPGVPSGKGRRRLLIAVPGQDEAKVTVQGMARDGAFAPTGERALEAPALAVTPFDLGLGGKPAALRLVADRPIVAALVAEKGDDFGVTAAVPPLGAGTGTGLVADDRDTTTLLLSAPPEHAAAVRLTQLMTQGPAGTAKDVAVPAGHTVEVAMPPPAGGDDYGLVIAPRPGSGPVYAARLLEMKKKGFTLLPVPPARMTAVLPPVADSPVPWPRG